MHPEIVAALQRINDAEGVYRATARRVILNCAHQELLEFDLNSDATPPMRVCNLCGLAETGWGIGWRVLFGLFRTDCTDGEFYAARTAHIYEVDKRYAEDYLEEWLRTKSFLRDGAPRVDSAIKDQS